MILSKNRLPLFRIMLWGHNSWVGVMTGIRTAAILVALAGSLALPAAGGWAQTQVPARQLAQASQPQPDEVPTPRRIGRPPTRLRVHPNYLTGPEGVYPRYFPGSNALRYCSVKYVQEYRLSGTVITPHMHCVWGPG